MDDKGTGKEEDDEKDTGKTEETDDEDKVEDEGKVEVTVDQTLNVNIKTEPPSLHPGSATDTTSGAVLNQTFEGLMRVNQEGEVEEAMAESYDNVRRRIDVYIQNSPRCKMVEW